MLSPSVSHDSRGRHPELPLRKQKNRSRRAFSAIVLGAATLAAFGQYPGTVTKKSKDTPVLRAIAVLEWTGQEGKPNSSRLVPVSVFDGQALQDGGLYLARPQPLAVTSEVEYQLEKNGKPVGLFDIRNAGQEQGSWVGYGTWKPMPSAVPKTPGPVLDEGADDSDRPTLHRKKPSSSGSSDSGTGSGEPSAPSDPDRPTLHKKPSATDTEAPPDPDRPTLHNKAAASALAQNEPSGGYTDPDRPVLKRGKSSGNNGPEVLPTLMGLPQEMQQAVAVSDARTRPEHPWTYTWANPDDEIKMKVAMEAIARDALGLEPPSHAPAANRAAAKTRTKPAPPQPPAELPKLTDEHFRVFELAYGSGATMVLSARTDGPLANQKFVTLIAQPDLYGNVLVLLKHVTDGSQLDDSPRMRLVDAVDALADNRGELLFEMRGTSQRQFALYRVLRGHVDKLFETGGSQYGVAPE